MAVALELIENINIDEIFKISGFVSKDVIDKLIEAIKKEPIVKAKAIINSIENLDCRNFIRQILQVLPNFDLNNKSINKIMELIGDIDYRISQGSDEKIQMTALIAELIENVQN